MKSKQIMFIDPDPNLRILLKDYLENHGYLVKPAESAHKALKMLEKKLPDLIICDVVLPDLSGIELIKRIREDARINYIPIIILSTLGKTRDRIEGLEAGADVYMVKPFEPKELEVQIKACLRRLGLNNCLSIDFKGKSLYPVASHNIKFTRREKQVLQLLVQGLTNKQIAQFLNVESRTIETHVRNILVKTKLNNRTQLSHWIRVNQIA